MIWSQHYEERLQQWTAVRSGFADLELDQALLQINDWWFRAPISARYLHWDDHGTWPTPWQLLNDDIYCEIARALGMLYTIAMTEDARIAQLEIVQTGQDNLVLVNQGKYILNWAPGQLLNISSKKIETKKTIHASDLLHLMG